MLVTLLMWSNKINGEGETDYEQMTNCLMSWSVLCTVPLIVIAECKSCKVSYQELLVPCYVAPLRSIFSERFQKRQMVLELGS